MTSIFGLVIAGGRSRRFGREKAAEPLAGRPLVGWVADRLAGGVERLAISARPGSAAAGYAEAHDLACLHDPGSGALADGPLAGVLEGLRWAVEGGASWLVTAPCDTPFLPVDYVDRLWSTRTSGGAVAITSEGLQPLCALWPIEALQALEYASAHPPIRDVLAGRGAAETSFPDPSAFDNLNTPQAFAAAQARLR